MHTFTEEHTPAYIVKKFPKASDLFKVHDINFCCKGDISLKATFKKQAIEGRLVLERLNLAYEGWKEKGNIAIDWDQESLTDITNYIAEHYHHFLQNELSSLGELVTRIYRVHGNHQPHLKELYALYNEFLIEAEMHLIKEATEVIPLIQAGRNMNQRAFKLELEQLKIRNNSMIQLLNDMRHTTNNFEPPIDACGSYRVTYARLLELETEMIDYVHLENNILLDRLAL